MGRIQGALNACNSCKNLMWIDEGKFLHYSHWLKNCIWYFLEKGILFPSVMKEVKWNIICVLQSLQQLFILSLVPNKIPFEEIKMHSAFSVFFFLLPVFSPFSQPVSQCSGVHSQRTWYAKYQVPGAKAEAVTCTAPGGKHPIAGGRHKVPFFPTQFQVGRASRGVVTQGCGCLCSVLGFWGFFWML